MKVKLLKKLRQIARERVTIYSVTTEESWRGKYVTGMSIGYNLPQYAHIFSFGMTEDDVKKKAEKIFFETEMEWVRKRYKKYTRRYKYGN
jgi:hypothetical protein